MVRLATAALLAPALWAVIRLAPPLLFYLIALGVISVASWECYRMLEVRGARPFKWVGLAAGAAFVWSFVEAPPHFEAHHPLVVLVGASVLLAIRYRPNPGAMLEATAYTLFPVLFVSLGLAYLVSLRAMPGQDGPDLVLLLFLCVILADTGAYYVGRSLGRTPLAPLLSPKKTWEGVAGGLVGSAIGALIAHFWFYQRLPLFHALVLGAILGLAGVAGDLAESMVKRASGVKDASTLLPGHGGVLDRTDSLLFSGPILYYYYRMFLQGGP